MGTIGREQAMMTARQSERVASLMFDAVKELYASELTQQAYSGETVRDFEIFAVTYLGECLMTGKVRPLGRRIDAQSYSVQESTGQAEGECFFEKPENLVTMTYVQGLLAFRQAPGDLRLKFKQLHAKGDTPYQAYQTVMAEWEERSGPMAELAGATEAEVHEGLTDAAARKMLKATPPAVRKAYAAMRKAGDDPAAALEKSLRQWRGDAA
jgi:hypothetical protein